jgi:hypothetical protein
VSFKKILSRIEYNYANNFDRVTEILDVAPIDLLNGSSKEFTRNMPDSLVSPELKKQAVDIEYHWVTEDVKTPCHLTSGIKLLPTVRQRNISLLMLAFPQIVLLATSITQNILTYGIALV